jgi:hypothetical protein
MVGLGFFVLCLGLPQSLFLYRGNMPNLPYLIHLTCQISKLTNKAEQSVFYSLSITRRFIPWMCSTFHTWVQHFPSSRAAAFSPSGVDLALPRNAKYVHVKPIFSMKHRQDGSPAWTDLLKIRDLYVRRRKFLVKMVNRFNSRQIGGLVTNQYA